MVQAKVLQVLRNAQAIEREIYICSSRLGLSKMDHRHRTMHMVQAVGPCRVFRSTQDLQRGVKRSAVPCNNWSLLIGDTSHNHSEVAMFSAKRVPVVLMKKERVAQP
jgi:hypothetical protein